MNLQISSNPNKDFYLFSIFSTPYGFFNVNLRRSVEAKTKGEALTNATALNIFKQIKWKSDVLSFLTKPVVCISLSAGLLVGSLFLPSISLSLLKILPYICGIAGGLLGYSIENSIKGFLPAVSQAYREQSEEAAKCIAILEQADHDMTFTFA